jgi:hypothetical protein
MSQKPHLLLLTIKQAISHLNGPVKKKKVGCEERGIVQVIEQITKEGTLTQWITMFFYCKNGRKMVKLWVNIPISPFLKGMPH